MKAEEDLSELSNWLQDITVDLPRHRRVLRSRLLVLHRQIQRSSSFRGLARKRGLSRWIASPKGRGGIVIMVSAIVIAGLMLLQSAVADNSARQLAIVAAYKVGQMDPKKLDLINRHYKGLDQCIQEALNSGSLHIATNEELRGLLRPELKKEYPSAKVYLAFTDQKQHRVLIALNTNNEPLYAVDVDGAEPEGGLE